MAILQQTKTVDLKHASYDVRQRGRAYGGVPSAQTAAQKITAVLLAERIRRAVEKIACAYNDITILTTVSLGAVFLKEGDTEATLFERADNALYQAKYEGRNCARLVG